MEVVASTRTPGSKKRARRRDESCTRGVVIRTRSRCCFFRHRSCQAPKLHTHRLHDAKTRTKAGIPSIFFDRRRGTGTTPLWSSFWRRCTFRSFLSHQMCSRAASTHQCRSRKGGADVVLWTRRHCQDKPDTRVVPVCERKQEGDVPNILNWSHRRVTMTASKTISFTGTSRPPPQNHQGTRNEHSCFFYRVFFKLMVLPLFLQEIPSWFFKIAPDDDQLLFCSGDNYLYSCCGTTPVFEENMDHNHGAGLYSQCVEVGERGPAVPLLRNSCDCSLSADARAASTSSTLVSTTPMPTTTHQLHQQLLLQPGSSSWYNFLVGVVSLLGGWTSGGPRLYSLDHVTTTTTSDIASTRPHEERRRRSQSHNSYKRCTNDDQAWRSWSFWKGGHDSTGATTTDFPAISLLGVGPAAAVAKLSVSRRARIFTTASSSRPSSASSASILLEGGGVLGGAAGRSSAFTEAKMQELIAPSSGASSSSSYVAGNLGG
ncbi:unnamed protein product, partial [Amoebophrya sp. A120]|eukprot:GSA120T00025269001.1